MTNTLKQLQEQLAEAMAREAQDYYEIGYLTVAIEREVKLSAEYSAAFNQAMDNDPTGQDWEA